MTTARARRGAAAHRSGRYAETLSAWLLRAKGYRVLARRYRVGVGEIDLIVRRGGVVAAVEVKARADHDRAAESVLLRQRRRVARALEHFLLRRPDLTDLAVRFDVMLVAPGSWPRHVAGAWRDGE